MDAFHPRTGPHPVHVVHRVGAAGIGAFLVVFAAAGLVQGVPLLSTVGVPVTGLSQNGVLAALSLLVGGVLVVSAVRGGAVASTVSVVVGGLFLLSGLCNLVVVGTPMNVFAFALSNVVFSVGVGLALLVLGSYGRFTGHLPADSPYLHDAATEPSESLVAERDEHRRSRTSITELADAERADALHHASPEQRRRLIAVNRHRTQDDRRRAWDASA
jgi:hypothetical protein